MSHFYGVLDGSRGTATRCGTKNSGLTVKAMSWGGCVRVDMVHDEKTGKDSFTVEQRQHPSNGAGIREIIAEGIIGQPTKKENGNAELIDALKTLVSEIEDMAIFDDSEKWESIVASAKAAIKKAEG